MEQHVDLFIALKDNSKLKELDIITNEKSLITSFCDAIAAVLKRNNCLAILGSYV